jgi:hypothetical protein
MSKIKNAKGFRKSVTCRTCDHFIYTSLEWIGECQYVDASFNFIDPKDHICDNHTKLHLTNDVKFYKDCIKALLEGLECQYVDGFIGMMTPEMCRYLGESMADRVKGYLLRNRQGSIESNYPTIDDMCD